MVREDSHGEVTAYDRHGRLLKIVLSATEPDQARGQEQGTSNTHFTTYRSKKTLNWDPVELFYLCINFLVDGSG
jgi:hypothetical protein